MLDQNNTVKFYVIAPEGVVYYIVALYAPDGDNDNYFNNKHGKVKQTNSDFQILIGDFNVMLDQSLDRFKYKTDNHVKGREVINSWILDVYRYLNPDI